MSKECNRHTDTKHGGFGYCQASASSSQTNADSFIFYYYEQDHLGNIRQVTKANKSKTGTVILTNNYYPFGAEFCDNSSKSYVQKHKYNGKEFDSMHGLNSYDYGARQYNPVTGRWDRVDPLAEKYYSTSPYVYCMNNPVRFIDPDGRKIKPSYVVGMNNQGSRPVGYVNKSSGKLITAMREIGKTTVGSRFIASFLEKGQSQYGVKGNGKHAKYTFNIYSIAVDDATEKFRLMGKSTGKMQISNENGVFEITMAIDASMSLPDIVETITHEMGLHGTAIDAVIAAYEEGGWEAAKKKYDELTSNDHSDLKNNNTKNPNVANYKSMQHELETNDEYNEAFQNASDSYNCVY